jgi:hypothetical protein
VEPVATEQFRQKSSYREQSLIEALIKKERMVMAEVVSEATRQQIMTEEWWNQSEDRKQSPDWREDRAEMETEFTEQLETDTNEWKVMLMYLPNSDDQQLA